jgi:hypothetical protein
MAMRTKPDELTFHEAARRLGITPDEALRRAEDGELEVILFDGIPRVPARAVEVPLD